MHRLQPVTRIRQRAVHDRGKRIGQIAFTDRAAKRFADLEGACLLVVIVIFAHAKSDTIGALAGKAHEYRKSGEFPHLPPAHYARPDVTTTRARRPIAQRLDHRYTRSMNDRVLLITGCSSGIGYDAAHGMARRSWRVLATCRTEADCARLRSEGLESFRLDYEDPATIRSAIETLTERTGGQIDALFNNGAYAIPGAVEDLPTDALRQIFEANLFGWHDLTRRVLPLMRAQGHGRIVNCSSVLGLVALKWRGAYVATKFALEGMTDTLRLEMQDTPIRVSLIEPGPIPTRFRMNAQKQFERWIDWQASPRAAQYKDTLLRRLYADQGKPDPFELPASAVTAKLVHALESPHPKAHYYVTRATWIAAIARRALPATMLDRAMGQA